MSHPELSSNPHELESLRSLIEGTASTTGHAFFRSLVEGLQVAIGTRGAWVAAYRQDTRELEAIAMKMGTEWWDGFQYPIDGTPCETAIDSGKLVHIPDRIVELYPDHGQLARMQAVSYLGAPLLDVDGTTIGHFAVLHNEPLTELRSISLFQVFAARASAELRRLKAEEALRERETHLKSLLDGARDAILGLDGGLHILLLNRAAERAFGDPLTVLGKPATDSFEPNSAERLLAVARRLAKRHTVAPWQWIAGGLEVRPQGASPFFAEATLSHYVGKGQDRFTLILRNINDRLEAEARIRKLEQRAEVLREELDLLHGFDAIVGHSPRLMRALDDVAQVAPLNTTVLLLGETGTGKELFARALHDASPRNARPMITVNCAAIPKDLIESELFGHERGAFTGATSRREGRFSLAHQSTLFLDELGELPLGLQAKLLRVLQEGEIQSVGGTNTRTVDVRVVAATNRDLSALVEQGLFREDLFYRLNVFPIRIPPLRERGEDVLILAQRFMDAFVRRTGRPLLPLDEPCRARLLAYNWPGNVRELQNVIERGIITAIDGRLNLDRGLPSTQESARTPTAWPNTEPSPPGPAEAPLLTASQMDALERENLVRALKRASGKVSGDKGAAALLGMKSTTLASRLKALGIVRER